MKKSPKNLELYAEVRKLVKRANQRLVRLEREFGVNTWAAKPLRNELDIAPLNAWTSSNRIRMNKSLTDIQLRAIKKATENFLNNKISTVRGAKQVHKAQVEGLQRILNRPPTKDDPGVNLTYEEAETLNEFFGDENAKDFISKMPESGTMISLIVDAKQVKKRDRRKYFFESFEQYIDFGNDLDMRRKLGRIYRKYVK